MRILAVIPARMGSSRFPGKPLALLGGQPMIQHVYRGTVQCEMLDDVVVATCDSEIASAVTAFGARAVMTSNAHERATDRVAEVSALDPAEIIVMVQGDEPMVHGSMVSAAVQPLCDDPALACVNLAAPIQDESAWRSVNTIKVVTNCYGDALVFSRAPIPHQVGTPFTSGRWLKQVCVIAFRRSALRRFAQLPQTPLEVAEAVDMLRFLENGIGVRIAPTEFHTHAVDTPEDLVTVESMMACRRSQ